MLLNIIKLCIQYLGWLYDSSNICLTKAQRQFIYTYIYDVFFYPNKVLLPPWYLAIQRAYPWIVIFHFDYYAYRFVCTNSIDTFFSVFRIYYWIFCSWVFGESVNTRSKIQIQSEMSILCRAHGSKKSQQKWNNSWKNMYSMHSLKTNLYSLQWLPLYY